MIILRVLIVCLMTTVSAGELDIKVKEKSIVLLQPLKQNLMKTLQTEIKSKGLIGGIEACKVEAPKIAKVLQDESKSIELGRTSHRLRNPENAPRDWVKPYLEHFVSSGENPKQHVIQLSQNRYGYLEPIFLSQPLCLQCHGSDIHSDIVSRIKTLYPNDQAIGFKSGEFRGFFWVELDLTEI